MNNGFYKFDGTLLYAQNFVHNQKAANDPLLANTMNTIFAEIQRQASLQGII